MASIKESRIEQALASCTAAARKVFDAVPVEEAWAVATIATETRRAHGTSPTLDVVQGCLAQLVEHGLVRESPRGMFRRVPMKVTVRVPRGATAEDPPSATVEQELAAPAAAADPIERFAAVAARMRDVAASLTDLARLCDDAAIEAQQQIELARAELAKLGELGDVEQVRADLAKLRQLQGLLQSIGGRP